MMRLRNHIFARDPITTNVGASSGPRISTAGFSWHAKYKGAGTLLITMFADLDGNQWQEDWDVCRRGAQALVPFSKRAAAAMRAGEADAVLTSQGEHQAWYDLNVSYEDSVEGYGRRVHCSVSFPIDSSLPVARDEQQTKWVERIAQRTFEMGTDLHMSVNDAEHRHVFHGSKS